MKKSTTATAVAPGETTADLSTSVPKSPKSRRARHERVRAPLLSGVSARYAKNAELHAERLLSLLTSLKKGDFSARLPVVWTGVAGEVADTLNELAEMLGRDLTAREEREERVIRLNRELEGRVAALTEVNRELETFNYSISHDLRAPLRSMTGFAKALIEEEADRLSPLGREYAERVMNSANYMNVLLRDLLVYSRLSRQEITLAPVDLEHSVRELLKVLEGEILEAKAQVEVVSPMSTVLAHWPTLQQVLGNLLGNSLKFVSTERAPRIRVFTTRSKGLVRLWVEDNGIGIRREYHEKIFGLFERLADARDFPGTGIGLALVRKGAERMGGQAGVVSEPGEGSRFWVALPEVNTPEDVPPNSAC